MTRIKDQLSPALVISVIALFVALGGGAYAALGKNSVGSKQLKKNAVVTKKIKNNAVTRQKIKNNAVNGAKVDEGSLGTVPSARSAQSADTVKGHSTFPQTRVTATSAPTENAAREAAPEVPLFTAGPVTIYAKCYTDSSGPRTYGSLFIKTSANGVLFDSDSDDADGEPFLNTATPELDRQLMYEYSDQNSASVYFVHSDETVAMTPDGLSFEARHSIAVKNGTLAGGNGLYGDGDVCLFAGDLTEYR